jgi:hypothetical protein
MRRGPPSASVDGVLMGEPIAVLVKVTRDEHADAIVLAASRALGHRPFGFNGRRAVRHLPGPGYRRSLACRPAGQPRRGEEDVHHSAVRHSAAVGPFPHDDRGRSRVVRLGGGEQQHVSADAGRVEPVGAAWAYD